MTDGVGRGKRWAGIAVVVVLAAGGGFWAGRGLPTSTAVVDVKSGHVGFVGAGSDEFYYTPDGSTATVSYGVSPAVPWMDAQGTWHESNTPPPCMAPLSKGQHISFGVVHVHYTPARSGDVVTWIRCQ